MDEPASVAVRRFRRRADAPEGVEDDIVAETVVGDDLRGEFLRKDRRMVRRVGRVDLPDIRYLVTVADLGLPNRLLVGMLPDVPVDQPVGFLA